MLDLFLFSTLKHPSFAVSAGKGTEHVNVLSLSLEFYSVGILIFMLAAQRGMEI